MNALKATMLAMLLTAIRSQFLPLPAKFISVPTAPQMDTTIKSNFYTVAVDLKGFAASLGQDPKVLFNSFSVGLTFVNLKFGESVYKMTYNSNQIAYYCPNGGSCPSFQPFSYKSDTVLANFIIHNPNLSIYFADDSMFWVTVKLLLGSKAYFGVISQKVLPNPVALSSIKASIPNQYSLGCLNLTLYNTMDKILYPSFSVVVSGPALTPYPIPGHNLTAFASPSAVLYLDNRLLPGGPVYQNGVYNFSNAVVLANTPFNVGSHTFSFCNVYLPSIVAGMYSLSLMSDAGITFMKSSASIAQSQGMLMTASALSQSSTLVNAVDTVSTNLTASVPYNWVNIFTLLITFQPALETYSQVSVDVKNLFDGTVKTIIYSSGISTAISVVLPVMSVVMTSGLQVTISGLKNPGIAGSYPIGFQLLDVNNKVISVTASTNLVAQ